MEIETIKLQELRQDEREVLDRDRERWRKMGQGAHLDDWLDLYPGLIIRRRLAMKIAHVNKPEGRGYALAFGQLMAADGLDDMDKTARSAVLWLGDDAERLAILRAIRDEMTPGQRARLNSPISARQKVEQVLKARDNPDGNPNKKASALSILKRQNDEFVRKVAHLEEKLAAAEQGSLFDLKNDTAKDIALTIVKNVSSGRAETIIREMRLALRAGQQAPAG